MGTLIRFLFVFFMVSVAGISIALFWNFEHRLPSISYNEFLVMLDSGEIVEVRVKGDELKITDNSGRRYSANVPGAASVVPGLIEKNIVVYGEPGTSPFQLGILAFGGLIFLGVIVWFAFAGRQQGKGDESSDFAKGKAINFASAGKAQVTFRDVAGIPEVKEELLEIVDFLQKPKKYSRLGAIIPKGILFQGPPGTGKTLLARAIAGEAGVPFYSISGSDFVEMFVGVGASRVRDLFKEAKKNTPCIIFIDEIDAVGGHRGSGGGVGGQDERGQTLNALLVEMDGFGSDDTIILLAATNRPDILDPALLRPRRFDRQITVLPPDVKGRQKILEVHTRRVRLGEGVDLESIARGTPGFTGAELASLVNEGALIAGRAEKDAIDMSDFESAKDRILMGVERKSFIINEQDRRTLAFHEAGHAILAKFLPEVDPLHKITIIPRGKAMGHTQQLPLHDRQIYSKDYLKNRIKILLGGRAAEEVCLNQKTTGAEDDFQQAMEIASNMICKWGMDDVVGPMSYIRGDEGFLGGGVMSGFSEETARQLDQEIKRLLESCYEDAVEILTREKDFLEHLAEILLKEEMLDSEEMEIIFQCTKKREIEKKALINEKAGSIPGEVIHDNESGIPS